MTVNADPSSANLRRLSKSFEASDRRIASLLARAEAVAGQLDELAESISGALDDYGAELWVRELKMLAVHLRGEGERA